MSGRIAKLLPASTVALSLWSSPAWAGDHGDTALRLLFMPTDLFFSAIAWLANTAHMPWLTDALAEVMSITQGWFALAVAVLCWSLAALVLRALAAGLRRRLRIESASGASRRSVKPRPKRARMPPPRRRKRSVNARLYA